MDYKININDQTKQILRECQSIGNRHCEAKRLIRTEKYFVAIYA